MLIASPLCGQFEQHRHVVDLEAGAALQRCRRKASIDEPPHAPLRAQVGECFVDEIGQFQPAARKSMMRRADDDHPLACEHARSEVVERRIRWLREREVEAPFPHLVDQRARPVQRQFDIDPTERSPKLS
jgi:hypothetical protein